MEHVAAALPKTEPGTCRRCEENDAPRIRYPGPEGRVLRGVCDPCRDEADAEEAGRAPAAGAGSTPEELMGEAGVDNPDHQRATLGGFDPDPDRHALEAARAFVGEYRAGGRPNLYLYSKRPGEQVAPGSGKTHLACAILRELLASEDLVPSRARFIRETRLTITLRRLIDRRDRAPEDFLDDLIGADLLVLDDVGKAKTDSPWLEELLFEFVAGREPRSTILTSNQSMDEHLRRRGETFASIASRLMAKGPQICLEGPDRRLLRRRRTA